MISCLSNGYFFYLIYHYSTTAKHGKTYLVRYNKI